MAVAAGALADGTPVILSGGHDGTVRVWRLADGTPVSDPLTGHTDVVNAVAAGALPDGTPHRARGDVSRLWRRSLRREGPRASRTRTFPVILSGGRDGTVRVWRTADGTPVVPPLDLPESVWAVAVHGKGIITAAGTDIAVHQPALPQPMR